MSSVAGGLSAGSREPASGRRGMTAEERKIIVASSLGTVFEWYDFYLYGTLATIIAKQYFAPLSPTAQFIMTLLAFAAGFAVRPVGAIVFGRLGDLVGRKHTFLITITLMGLSTFLVGLLPGYNSWGAPAPIILISLRLLQGLALGGEYGGAATYVAEHAPRDKRGAYTSWIQTTATVGLLLSHGQCPHRCFTGPRNPVFRAVRNTLGQDRAQVDHPGRMPDGGRVLFHQLLHYANPALEAAQAKYPAVVLADPDTCAVQFNPVGTAKFTALCDIAKSTLATSSVSYSNRSLARGIPTVVDLGGSRIAYSDFAAASGGDAAKANADFKQAIIDAIRGAGYPARADPARINQPLVVIILTILVIYVTMVYGPIAAMLVELFPTRIRYTSMSLPYHIGAGWFGGFLPATAFAIVAATGDIFAGLWYPIIVASMTFVVGAVFLPETKDRDIYAHD